MQNLKDRNPSVQDKKYVQCLHRANLDVMAGRARSTVEAHVGRIAKTIKYCKMINKTPHFEARGPFPLGDLVGMSLAVDMLMKSLEAKGRIGDYIQFDTIRETRSTYTKKWESSPGGIVDGSSFSGNASKRLDSHHVLHSQCGSEISYWVPKTGWATIQGSRSIFPSRLWLSNCDSSSETRQSLKTLSLICDLNWELLFAFSRLGHCEDTRDSSLHPNNSLDAA
jgi:hypothetical protein